MPATTIPAPGTRGGPCRGWCRHPVCKDQKHLARSKCLYCQKPVGYDVPIIPWGVLAVHAECHEEAVAAGTALFTTP